MKKLFIGLYGGILASILVVCGLAWWALDALNEQRYQAHLKSHLAGTTFLLQRGIARQAESDRARWVGLVSTISDTQVTPIETPTDAASRYAIQAEAGGRYRLSRGEPISRLGVALSVTHLSEQLMTATAFLLLNDLGSFAPDIRQTQFDEIRGKMPFPVVRASQARKTLNKQQIARLNRGEVVIELGKEFDRNHTMKVYAPWGKSDDLLVLGPIQLFDPYPLNVLLGVFLLALFLITATIFLLIRQLGKRLQVVQHTVDTIDPEYLGEAPAYQADDAIGMLNYKIHQMMTRIHRLFEEQAYMVRAVSHDLRTPISKIHFRLESLADELGENHPTLIACKRNLDQLNALIDELLTYEKLSQVAQITLAELPLQPLVENVVEEFKTTHQHVTVSLLDSSGESASCIQGNELLLKRALDNLLQNGARHARSALTLHLQQTRDHLTLVIEDDGPGISPEAMRHVFKPFFRADESRNAQSGGYGLGLAIVKQIMRQHHGEILAENAPGGGARFILRFPARALGRSGALP